MWQPSVDPGGSHGTVAPMEGGPPPRHRVIHLIANLEVGGAQEVVRSLAPGLRAHGWEPVVATLRDGPLRAPLEAEGTRVVLLRPRSHPVTRPLAAMSEVRRLRHDLADLVRSESAEILQTHLARSVDILAWSIRDRPPLAGVLWTAHNARLELRPDQVPQRGLLGAKRLAYRWSYRTMCQRGGAFVAVSTEVALAIDSQVRPPRRALHVIPNGVDPARYGDRSGREVTRRSLDLDPDATVAIVVAKLHPQKGHDHLLTALPSVLAQVPGLTVLLVGDGPLRSALEARTRALGLEHAVRFLGIRPDIPALLAASDLFLLPSLWEGLPMALLEAMATGLPAIATRVSGTQEVIEDGTSGVLVPAGEPAALGSAIVAVLRDAERRERLGNGGRERVVAQYSVARQAAAHAALYERLCTEALDR